VRYPAMGPDRTSERVRPPVVTNYRQSVGDLGTVNIARQTAAASVLTEVSEKPRGTYQTITGIGAMPAPGSQSGFGKYSTSGTLVRQNLIDKFGYSYVD
jgi:hypothetical protein